MKSIVNERQKAFHEGNKPLYNRLRNLANREMKKLKGSFLKRKLEQLKSYPNSKKWWDIKKRLSGIPKKGKISAGLKDKYILTGLRVIVQAEIVTLI